MTDPFKMEPNERIPSRGAAKVIVRPVGSSVEGNLYQGTELLRRCSNCPQPQSQNNHGQTKQTK